jgi:hypothetical protein
MTVLREGLLDGRAVALGGSGDPPSGGSGGPGLAAALTAALTAALAALGARVEDVPALDGGDEERVGEWARSRAPLHALVYAEHALVYAEHALVYAERGFEDLLADAWAVVREVATGAMIAGGLGGKIVLVAPFGEAAVAAGLENLARTLSVEWARYGVTAVAIAPGARSTDDDLAELVCFLVSVAGEYFSGCEFQLI